MACNNLLTHLALINCKGIECLVERAYFAVQLVTLRLSVKELASLLLDLVEHSE